MGWTVVQKAPGLALTEGKPHPSPARSLMLTAGSPPLYATDHAQFKVKRAVRYRRAALFKELGIKLWLE